MQKKQVRLLVKKEKIGYDSKGISGQIKYYR